jgi:hypothetical protein
LLACLAKKPADRPASASELQKRLVACASDFAWTPEDAKRCWQEVGRKSAE